MFTNPLINKIYSLSNWIVKICYVNLLWGIFMLVGLIVFGFFPATVALFTVYRKWMLGDRDISIFSTFWSAYKKEFIPSNLLGALLLFIGLVLYAHLLMIQQTTIIVLHYLYVPLLLICGLYLSTILSFFPMYVHYDTKGFQLIKNAFLIGFIAPISFVKHIIGLGIISYLFITFPGSVLLFGGCIPALYMMWVANSAFTQYERKRAIQQQT